MARRPQEFIIHDTETVRPIMHRVWQMVNKGLQAGTVVVTLQRINKTREQEKKYHAMIRDISQQVSFDYAANEDTGFVTRLFGRDRKKHYSVSVWKALLVEQFAREKEAMGEPLTHPGETVQSLDGTRVITVRPSTRDFRVKEAAQFIEYLYMQGTEMDVKWSEKALKVYEEYREAV